MRHISYTKNACVRNLPPKTDQVLCIFDSRLAYVPCATSSQEVCQKNVTNYLVLMCIIRIRCMKCNRCTCVYPHLRRTLPQTCDELSCAHVYHVYTRCIKCNRQYFSGRGQYRTHVCIVSFRLYGRWHLPTASNACMPQPSGFKSPLVFHRTSFRILPEQCLGSGTPTLAGIRHLIRRWTRRWSSGVWRSATGPRYSSGSGSWRSRVGLLALYTFLLYGRASRAYASA